MINYKIAIDGTAGSGKSTIAKELAKELKIDYINTGLMYRCATKVLLDNNIIDDELKAKDYLSNSTFNYIDSNTIEVNEVELKLKDLMGKELTSNIYKIANNEILRPILVNLQIDIYKTKDKVLMEGRDITTVIMKDAVNKFYIDASPEVRAKRRMEQTNSSKDDYKAILERIIIRDNKDKKRKLGPLKQAKDAILVDTTNMDIEESIKFIKDNLKAK
jgi:cytidylate kinase